VSLQKFKAAGNRTTVARYAGVFKKIARAKGDVIRVTFLGIMFPFLLSVIPTRQSRRRAVTGVRRCDREEMLQKG
jgi:hypothetical protein